MSFWIFSFVLLHVLGGVRVASQSTCPLVPVNAGYFGQGVPSLAGANSQGNGPYTMMDIDGASEFPSGRIYQIEWRQHKAGSVYFQVWRPRDHANGRYELVYQLRLEDLGRGDNQREYLLPSPIDVIDHDHWGFFYNQADEVPIKWSQVSTKPLHDNNKPYYALECLPGTSSCGIGVPIGNIATFNPNVVFKQFRMRACLTVFRPDPSCPPPIVSGTTSATTSTTRRTTSYTTPTPTTSYTRSTTSYTRSTTKDKCPDQCPTGPQGPQGPPGPPGTYAGRKRRSLRADDSTQLEPVQLEEITVTVNEAGAEMKQGEKAPVASTWPVYLCLAWLSIVTIYLALQHLLALRAPRVPHSCTCNEKASI